MPVACINEVNDIVSFDCLLRMSVIFDCISNCIEVTVSGAGDEVHAVRFEDDGKVRRGSAIVTDGVPFIVVGSRLMECHQGPLINSRL
jgi:hypothetical protein